jgi:GT2 family glycosyltransferase
VKNAPFAKPTSAVEPPSAPLGAPPFVSVVIPTRGRKAMLARLLEALQRQTYSHGFEIIVVHNWTADGTEELVTDLAAAGSGPPIMYFRKHNRSPTASRQFGAGIGRGDVIAFIDDDCEPHPDWLVAGIASMGRGIGLVQGCTLPRHDQPRRLLEKTVSVTGPTPYFETCNIFYRREAFEAVGGFSVEFHARFWGEDIDLGWKVTEAGWSSAFAPDALVYHEVFKQSLVEWHSEALHLQVWPMLVRKWPGLRRHLYRRYFLSRQSAAFVCLLVGLGAGLAVHPAGLAFAAPYVMVRAIETGRYRNPAVIAARVVLGLPRSALVFAALAFGSLRHRTLVL